MAKIEHLQFGLYARVADQIRHLLDVARDIDHGVRAEIHRRNVEAAYLRTQSEHMLDPRFRARERAPRTGAPRVLGIRDKARAGAGRETDDDLGSRIANALHRLTTQPNPASRLAGRPA